MWIRKYMHATYSWAMQDYISVILKTLIFSIYGFIKTFICTWKDTLRSRPSSKCAKLTTFSHSIDRIKTLINKLTLKIEYVTVIVFLVELCSNVEKCSTSLLWSRLIEQHCQWWKDIHIFTGYWVRLMWVFQLFFCFLHS